MSATGSIRQRVPFRFSGDGAEEDNHILDEQEQEELIRKLKDESNAQNNLYTLLIQIIIYLSAVLHLIYLFSSDREPPIATLFPKYTPPVNFSPIPASPFFTCLNLLIHVNLSILLFRPSHPFRFYTSPYMAPMPFCYPILFGLSAIAPLLSLSMRNGWHDLAWWTETAAVTCFVHSAQKWIRQETDGIRTLEALRYDAKGA